MTWAEYFRQKDEQQMELTLAIQRRADLRAGQICSAIALYFAGERKPPSYFFPDPKKRRAVVPDTAAELMVLAHQSGWDIKQSKEQS